MGGWNAFWFYMLWRTIESNWFTWVTQMNHIPMHVDNDRALDWPTLQGLSTCNVDGGLFNDWFTGHLNYQIEHHLFPHICHVHYPQLSPIVAQTAREHGLQYQVRPTFFNALAAHAQMLKQLGQ